MAEEGVDALLASRNKLLRAAGWASVLVAVALLVLKLVVWWATQSASVLASLVDSAMDLASSSLNLFALRFATQPADDEHRFGHGKAEALGAFTQAILLSLSALGILIYAGTRLTEGRALEASALPLGETLMLVVLLLTGLLVAFQIYVIRRTASPLVSADSLHYRSDFLINGSVLLALYVSAEYHWLDAALAIVIALYIGWSAYGIFRGAVHELLDRELPQEVDRALADTARDNPLVANIHGLKTRRAGGVMFVQMDIEVDGDISLRRAHECSRDVKAAILENYPDAEILIHVDPIGQRRRG